MAILNLGSCKRNIWETTMALAWPYQLVSNVFLWHFPNCATWNISRHIRPCFQLSRGSIWEATMASLNVATGRGSIWEARVAQITETIASIRRQCEDQERWTLVAILICRPGTNHAVSRDLLPGLALLSTAANYSLMTARMLASMWPLEFWVLLLVKMCHIKGYKGWQKDGHFGVKPRVTGQPRLVPAGCRRHYTMNSGSVQLVCPRYAGRLRLHLGKSVSKWCFYKVAVYLAFLPGSFLGEKMIILESSGNLSCVFWKSSGNFSCAVGFMSFGLHCICFITRRLIYWLLYRGDSLGYIYIV